MKNLMLVVVIICVALVAGCGTPAVQDSRTSNKTDPLQFCLAILHSPRSMNPSQDKANLLHASMFVNVYAKTHSFDTIVKLYRDDLQNSWEKTDKYLEDVAKLDHGLECIEDSAAQFVRQWHIHDRQPADEELITTLCQFLHRDRIWFN